MAEMDAVFCAVLQRLYKGLVLVDQSGVVLMATGIVSELKTGQLLSELLPAISLQDTKEDELALYGPVELSPSCSMLYQIIAVSEPQCTGYCLVFQPLSEQKMQQRKSDQIQQLLFSSERLAVIGQLTISVAHEINNPVSYVHSNLLTLSGYVEHLIKIIELLPEQQSTQASDIIKSRFDYDYICKDIRNLLTESAFGLEQVMTQIMSLKDLSHTDEGQFKAADIEAGIVSSLTIVNNELKYKAVIHKDFAGLPKVECIPSQLNQVILNLLVNAGHAISDHGEIYIRTGMQQNWVWVEIEDNGSGISDEHLSRIFEPFFTTKGIGKGTGLGLALSQNIIERHQGRLEVKTKVGQGTSFKIWLPVTQAQACSA